ncbi:hypothetical protein EUX98_g2636 [Antrodiella citrinella]|uniref:F-box domain-containing protein n=1 Tax=Antrodiella citrinella TaxID=2447956 RepID=A0A4S4MYG8_9APHY|nr:hypothetical protein EUX98_g2636 [Antrodiella citrinella]
MLSITCMLSASALDANRFIALPADPRCLPCISNFTSFAIYSSGEFCGVFAGSDTIAVWLSLDGDFDRKAVMNSFRLIVKHYPMPRLQCFRILDGWLKWHSSMEEDVISFLRGCPKLTTLHIEKPCVNLGKLALHLSHPVSPLCPSLCTVRLRNVVVRLADLIQFCRAFFYNSSYEVPMVAAASAPSPEFRWGTLRQHVAGVQKTIRFDCKDTKLTGEDPDANSILNVEWDKYIQTIFLFKYVYSRV